LRGRFALLENLDLTAPLGDKYSMQQYTQSAGLKSTRKPEVKSDTSPVEARLIDLVNRLSEQNALQARQIRRLESDLTLLKESLNRIIK
jgi:hypothetical protein